jgi:hypothetical protein
VVCEVFLVQRLRFIAVAILSILVITIVGAVSLSPAYAPPPSTITLSASPNPALPNQALTFSGQVTPAAADNIVVYVNSASVSCPDDIRFVPLALNLVPSFNPALKFTGTADSAGSYSITVPGGFAAGLYGAIAIDESSSAVSGCDSFTVSPMIPEYPFGLVVLAAFMIAAYGAIIRKTVTKQNLTVVSALWLPVLCV